ncbi:MAG: YciI family protein [Chitinophagaceae bacterium]
MQQFLLIARDGQDEAALERRMAARPAHFESASRLKAEGHFIMGGAMLDEQGKMNGSVMVVQFPDRQALNEWLKTEPYLLGKVWEEVDIRDFKLADV